MTQRSGICQVCNRPLRSAASKAAGMGPKCAAKLGIKKFVSRETNDPNQLTLNIEMEQKL